jgi:hypothetical protein
LGLIEFVLLLLNIPVHFSVYSLTREFRIAWESRRISSIFTEPAHLSIFIGSFASLIIAARRYGIQIRYYKASIYLGFVTILLSFSLVGYSFLAVLVWILMHDARVQRKRHTFVLFGYSLLIVCLLLLWISILSDTTVFEDAISTNRIANRIAEVTKLNDASANARLIGSWEYAMVCIGQSRLAGVGLGQRRSFYAANARNKNMGMRHYWGYGAVNNVLASILMQTGIIGLGLFVVFAYQTLKSDRSLLLIFVLLCFSWGYFNTAMFWFFLYMAFTICSTPN